MTDEELIKAIAEMVMGWVNFIYLMPGTEDGFDPLTNANHTMMVVERMRGLGWRVRIHNTLFRPPDELWRVWFIREIDEYWTSGRAYPSLGHAVCLAALKAMASLEEL